MVQLELEKITILRDKERWKLYFVVVINHPTEEGKYLLTVLPDENVGTIELKPKSNNEVNFEAQGTGTEGFLLLQTEMPDNRSINVRFWLRHSRRNLRKVSTYLGLVKDELGGEAGTILTSALGISNPWLVITNLGLNLMGNVLEKIKDRDLGFISMYEKFGPEFENQTELDRSNTTSTKDAKIVWSWSTV